MSEFAAALEATLFAGAAREACRNNPERLVRLRQMREPLMEAIRRGDYEGAKRVIRSVMPEGWEPGEAWRLAP